MWFSWITSLFRYPVPFRQVTIHAFLDKHLTRYCKHQDIASDAKGFPAQVESLPDLLAENDRHVFERLLAHLSDEQKWRKQHHGGYPQDYDDDDGGALVEPPAAPEGPGYRQVPVEGHGCYGENAGCHGDTWKQIGVLAFK